MTEAWENVKEITLFVVELPFLVIAAVAAMVLHAAIFVVDTIEESL